MTWTTDTLLTCELCQISDKDVERLLFHWQVSEEHPLGMTWEWLARCKDKAACRARVEGSGRTWPEEVRREEER